ncbi:MULTISPECIES: AAA family ATPase [unclassified Marinobacter]|uniref:AAA family ATPase n=1 Tax=unclassified Marinobacter TaxID=83889 RepID=UPI0019286763|nr:CbbQ/NirQ/NorQ C-terminal domain-containing protein [Marinobacter sp. MC3]MBL3895258.1 CbbQ/NirQ/NorQ C-terminal domain-containing protein [Marinobacter sp. MW3]
MTVRDQAMAIRNTFNLDVPVEVMTAGFSDINNPFIPKRNDGYVFRRETLRDILSFLDDPDGDGLYFSGHYGAGKTTLPYQVASRLNWPVQSFTAHSRMEFDDLVGTWKLVNGSMEFVYGPLSIAMRDGHLFILNEIDRADPGQLAALHDVLEGHPLVIATNGGEIIHAHENFRFIVNGNSLGSGDSTGLYQGVNQLDIAFLDRFRMVEVDYPTEDVELMILEQKTPELPGEIRRNMVRVANQIRRLFIGGEESATPLTVTMSTRTLCRWAKLSLSFRNAPNALAYALKQSLTAKAEPEQRIAIEQIAKDVFGSNWTQGDTQ